MYTKHPILYTSTKKCIQNNIIFLQTAENRALNAIDNTVIYTAGFSEYFGIKAFCVRIGAYRERKSGLCQQL